MQGALEDFKSSMFGLCTSGVMWYAGVVIGPMEGQHVCTHWEAGRPSINSRFPGSVGGDCRSRSVTAAFALRTPWCPVTQTFHLVAKSDGTKEIWSFLFHSLPPPIIKQVCGAASCEQLTPCLVTALHSRYSGLLLRPQERRA